MVPKQPAFANIVDCDIHPVMRDISVLREYLPAAWRSHLDTYGLRMRQAFLNGPPYPKASPALSRRDSWPPAGGPPGSDLDFMRLQHLDSCHVGHGILHVLGPSGRDQLNPGFGNAISTALNRWLEAEWVDPEPRLSASINISYDDAVESVREIERCARHPGFVTVAFPSRTMEPIGRRRYWPIFAAAAAHGLPISVHTGGTNGVVTASSGWPSFYAEDHHAQAISMQAVLASLIFEGVFEAFPWLKVALVEAGFAWASSLCWRMDRQFERMRDEVPHLTRRPSEYVKQQVWFATQPVDEPTRGRDILQTIDWLGWDRLIFSSDYPHWDMDHPRFMFKAPLTEQHRRMVYSGNAHDCYSFASRSVGLAKGAAA